MTVDVVCTELKVFILLFTLLWLVMMAGGALLTLMQQKRLHFIPELDWWPTIESVEYTHTLPLAVAKRCLLAVYLVLATLLFAFYLASVATAPTSPSEGQLQQEEAANVSIHSLDYLGVGNILGYSCNSKVMQVQALFITYPDVVDSAMGVGE